MVRSASLARRSAPATPIAATKSRSRSSVTACRSASRANSFAPTPSATTQPKSTAPSPTPAVDRGGSMRPRTRHPLSWTNRSHFVARVPGSHIPGLDIPGLDTSTPRWWFYTAGWDAPGRNGPGRHAAGRSAVCVRPCQGREGLLVAGPRGAGVDVRVFARCGWAASSAGPRRTSRDRPRCCVASPSDRLGRERSRARRHTEVSITNSDGQCCPDASARNRMTLRVS